MKTILLPEPTPEERAYLERILAAHPYDPATIVGGPRETPLDGDVVEIANNAWHSRERSSDLDRMRFALSVILPLLDATAEKRTGSTLANRISSLEAANAIGKRLIDDGIAHIKAMNTALAPLAAIADAYDANDLDDEARKLRGSAGRTVFNDRDPKDIELYSGRGGRRLLTLADAFAARDALAFVPNAGGPPAPARTPPSHAQEQGERPFHPWHGNDVGPAEARPEDRIEYRMRDARADDEPNNSRNSFLRWTHLGRESDIIAWRFADPARDADDLPILKNLRARREVLMRSDPVGRAAAMLRRFVEHTHPGRINDYILGGRSVAEVAEDLEELEQLREPIDDAALAELRGLRELVGWLNSAPESRGAKYRALLEEVEALRAAFGIVPEGLSASDLRAVLENAVGVLSTFLSGRGSSTTKTIGEGEWSAIEYVRDNIKRAFKIGAVSAERVPVSLTSIVERARGKKLRDLLKSIVDVYERGSYSATQINEDLMVPAAKAVLDWDAGRPPKGDAGLLAIAKRLREIEGYPPKDLDLFASAASAIEAYAYPKSQFVCVGSVDLDESGSRRVEPIKRWPFLESPGELATRLNYIYAATPSSGPGAMLAALRHCLIEAPPALAAWLDPGAAAKDAAAYNLLIIALRHAFPDFRDYEPITTDRVLALGKKLDAERLLVLENALRFAFPHFQEEALITPEVIRSIGDEYQKMIMNWGPIPLEIEFHAEGADRTFKITYESDDDAPEGWFLEEGFTVAAIPNDERTRGFPVELSALVDAARVVASSGNVTRFPYAEINRVITAVDKLGGRRKAAVDASAILSLILWRARTSGIAGSSLFDPAQLALVEEVRDALRKAFAISDKAEEPALFGESVSTPRSIL